MSRKSNSSLKIDQSNFLFPEIYINSGDNLFCVTYFKSNPEKLDLRDPADKLKECQDHLQSGEELTPQDKFETLSRINSFQKILHTENSIEYLRSEAELGFFYNENMNPQSAIRHLEKAHSLEKAFKIDQEESIRIAVETALAHFFLRKSGEDHLSKAAKTLKPYYSSEISDCMLRFKRDLAKSRILSAQKKYSDAAKSYEETILSLQEVNENIHSQAEAQLYLETAETIEKGSKSIPVAKEKSAECYMNAHKIFLEIGEKELADRIDQSKLPKCYIEELKRVNEEENSTDEKLLATPLNKNKIEFVSNDGTTFEQTPDNIRKEIIRIQNRLSNNNNGKVKIEYLPPNDNRSSENDSSNEQPIEPLPVPPPSEIVDSNFIQSQIYLLTHDQPKIPEETKTGDVKKYTKTDSAAQSVASFNNSILANSRYKTEMENNQNDTNNKTSDEDPYARFRSRRRKK